MTMDAFARLIEANRFARLLGRDRPAAQVLERAVSTGTAPVSLRRHDAGTDGGSEVAPDDYALIDPALAIADTVGTNDSSEVLAGTGYAGMTPQQRATYLAWLHDPSRPAPPGYQDLYLATLEVRLFEGGTIGDDAFLSLRAMQLEPAWRHSRTLERSILLGFWLRQDGPQLTKWLLGSPVAADLFATGLGLQALLGEPLTTDELAKIGELWDQPALHAPQPLLKLRLSSLAASLGTEPLIHVLGVLGETARQPRPWRCAHRDLRIALPQPALRSTLEPLLAEMASIRVAETSATIENSLDADVRPATIAAAAGGFTEDDSLILEFGQSRSEYFDFVLQLAQRQPGFTQLMDEDRRLVYRIRFHKDRLRNFWRIWEYVQKWSSTKVYVNGQEIEQWKIWPYSQYLR